MLVQMADPMSATQIREALTRAQAEGRKVQIEHQTSADYFNGFVLGLSDKLVYLRLLGDFQFDGFVVLRLGDLRDVRSGDNERFFERVLRAEGRLEGLKEPPELDLDGVRSVLASLLECEPYVTLEDEDRFLVGRLERIEGDQVLLTYIRVNGTVDAPACEVSIPAIEVITFGGDYLAMFRKHGSWELD